MSADKNPKYSTSPGNNTTDKVFLLSITEVNKYFTSSKARMCVPTDYAIAQGVNTYSSYSVDGKAICWWWLRSPGGHQNLAAYVINAGDVYEYGYVVINDIIAVRPALWIDLNS